MKFSVDLESPFAFSSYWYVMGVAMLILGAVLLFLYDRFFKISVESPFRIDRLYKKCVKQIGEIERGYGSGELDSRAAHQKMSCQVRNFMQAVTGLPAQSMVYGDLLRRGRPELASLIGEYYGPEFSYSSEADAKSAIEKGRTLVKEEYLRSVKARKVNAAAAFHAGLNDMLGGLIRRAPLFLTPAITDMIRSNTRRWIGRIEKALSKGEIDTFNVHKQMSAVVKSFLQAVTGVRTEAMALEALKASGGSGAVALEALKASGGSGAATLEALKASGRSGAATLEALKASGRGGLASLAGPYYEPEYVCRSETEAQLSIQKGKELIEKWI